MHLIRPIASAACLALLLGGCAETPRNVVFMTKASIGIDIESTAQTASVAYDRVEGYYAPRYAGQEPPAVYASLATNGKMIDRKIKQVYATGNAAKIVSTPISQSPPAAAPPDRGSNSATAGGAVANTKSMFFGTGTVFGLKLGFGPTSLDSFTLGFKRKELSIIPHDPSDTDFPSVMASFNGNQATIRPDGGSLSIKQFFATGVAAESLASNPQIRREFEDEAISRLAEYREDERQQYRLALLSLACLARLDDAQTHQVWQNVEQLALFDPSAIAELLSAPSTSAARTVYTNEIGMTKAISKDHTNLMRQHQAYVCELGSKT